MLEAESQIELGLAMTTLTLLTLKLKELREFIYTPSLENKYSMLYLVLE